MRELPGNFFPRRGCPRVLKFCMGFQLTKLNKIRGETNKGDPPLLPVAIFFMGVL